VAPQTGNCNPEPAGVAEALASLTPIERNIFRRTIMENASVAEVSVSTFKVVATSGFTSWIHMVLARQYVMSGAALLLSGSALELTLSSSKVRHSPLSILQVLLVVFGILLFVVTFYRLSTAKRAKRRFVADGRHQAELGVQQSESHAVITMGLCAAFGVLGLDELVMGFNFATSKFEVTKLTGYLFIAVSLCWLGACVGMIRKRHSARIATAQNVGE
jgi:uncharacterized membrane protein YidH (DUF202 family)